MPLFRVVLGAEYGRVSTVSILHDFEEIDDLVFVDGVDQEIIYDQDIGLNKALVRTSYIIHQWPLMNIVLWQN